MKTSKKQRVYEALATAILAHDIAHHFENPTISDDIYDSLKSQLRHLETKKKTIIVPWSVGYYRPVQKKDKTQKLVEFTYEPSASLDNAKADYRRRLQFRIDNLVLNEVEECPLCNQKSPAIRERQLNSTMIRQLIAIDAYFETEGADTYLHVPNYLAANKLDRECAKPVLWKLIEEKPEDKVDGNPHSGYYRRKDTLHRFLTDLNFKVPRYAYVLGSGNVLLGFSKEEVNVVQAGGNKFNYNELMATRSSFNVTGFLKRS